MAMDDASRIRLQLAKSYKAAPFLQSAHVAGNAIFLKVGIETELVFRRQNAIPDPALKVIRGARIDVILSIIVRGFASANNAGEIVRAKIVVARLHRGRNLVIRLGDDVRKAANLRGIVM